MDGNEERIRQRAYELWEQSGKEFERHFWLQAEKEVTKQDNTDAPPQDRLE